MMCGKPHKSALLNSVEEYTGVFIQPSAAKKNKAPFWILADCGKGPRTGLTRALLPRPLTLGSWEGREAVGPGGPRPCDPISAYYWGDGHRESGIAANSACRP